MNNCACFNPSTRQGESENESININLLFVPALFRAAAIENKSRPSDQSVSRI